MTTSPSGKVELPRPDMLLNVDLPMTIGGFVKKQGFYTAGSMLAFRAAGIADHQATITALQEEVQRLRVNDARYRWLRDSDDESIIDSVYPFSMWENTHWLKRKDALDFTIDAALSARAGGEKSKPA